MAKRNIKAWDHNCQAYGDKELLIKTTNQRYFLNKKRIRQIMINFLWKMYYGKHITEKLYLQDAPFATTKEFNPKKTDSA